MVNQAGTGVIQADATGRMTLVNRRWCEMLGYSETELLQMTIADVTDPAVVSQTLEAVRLLAEGGSDFVMEKRYRRKDGSLLWASSSVNALRGPTGQYLGLVAVALDIGERKRAEEALRESEERFRNMADHSPLMLWVTDSAARCTYLSRQWFEFTGLTMDRGLGFGWLEAIHPDDRGQSDEVFRKATESLEPFRSEYRLRRHDGVYRWAIDAAVPRFGRGGEFLGYNGSVIDITERKEAEETLRRIASDLTLSPKRHKSESGSVICRSGG
ncbi:MAG: PAS domain S-box protein [Betaproteobacteria bacterium]|nr:PAS domain S-box protein [Betaproteobacteria bacterium]